MTLIQRYLLLFFALLASVNALQASHLIGGNMGYLYLGPDPVQPQNSRFLVYFQAYMDCNSQFWDPTNPVFFPEPNIELGVYAGTLTSDTLLPHNSNLVLNRIQFDLIQPQLPANCTFQTNTCVALVLYQNEISLPNSSNGYHILYDRCCRPPGIINLNNSGNQPITYKVFIPAENGTLLQNSTPVFTDTLSSYMCLNDTNYITNIAIDPDGDSIVYSLEVPYRGLTTNSVPVATYNAAVPIQFNPYPNPPTSINWATNHGITQLFGPFGFQDINTNTGLTRFYSTVAGTFVAAVEIKEYRNGVLISKTRRDIQLLAINCPVNPIPTQDISNLDSTAISPTQYNIDAGESFCINLQFYDPNGDSLFLTASGAVFDTAQTNPPATISYNTQGGDSTISAQFCWASTCSQGRLQPYTFDISITDNGCPPKTFMQTFEIYITPFEGPTQITGDSLLCGDTISSYSVVAPSNATLNWNVAGGNIVTNNGNNILVNWGTASSGNVSFSAVNSLGCTVGPIQMPITISQIDVDAGSDINLCRYDSIQIGGSPTTGLSSYTVVWSPAVGLSDPSIPNPMVFPTINRTYTVQISDTLGCVKTDSLEVSIIGIVSSFDEDSTYLCPGDTFTLFTDSVQANLPILWTPSTFLSTTSPNFTRFSPPTSSWYRFNYMDVDGCLGKDSIYILVNGEVPTNAGPDQSICLGDTVTIGGNPIAPPNTNFVWLNAASLSDANAPNPSAFPSTTTTYILSTSNDTCSGLDTVVIEVFPLPLLSLSPDTIICENDTANLFALGSGQKTWFNSQSLSSDTADSVRAFPLQTTVYRLELTDSNNCKTMDSVTVQVQAYPIANANGPLLHVCKNLPFVMGSPGDSSLQYIWTPASNLNDSNLANPVLITDRNLSFTLRVSDSVGCSSFDSVNISVFRAFGGTDTSLCERDTVVFQARTENGLAPFSVRYLPTAGVVNPNILPSPIVAGNANEYAVVVEDSVGCSDTLSVKIQSGIRSTASFDVESVANCKLLDLKTTNNSLNSDSYMWFVNGELKSDSNSPRFSLPYGNNYEIKLIALNNNGCHDTIALRVDAPNLNGILGLMLQNVMTPNGDGINDFLEFPISQELANCVDLQVYNRWGHLVYESKGFVPSWDGRSFSGEVVPTGVYFYILTVNGVEYRQSINLYR